MSATPTKPDSHAHTNTLTHVRVCGCPAQPPSTYVDVFPPAQKSLKLEKTIKKTKAFPTRKFALKA